MESALYVGWLRHRRTAPVPHAFRYPLFMLYLDLAEIDTVFAGRRLWSTSRPALVRWNRRDHIGDPSTPLDVSVRELVRERTGVRPDGPIRLLTHPRCCGYGFNPVSFFYCFDRADRLDTIVAEVNNTPWGERHCYVVPATASHRKTFHVSPFMPMDVDYAWRFSDPGRHLVVHMRNQRRGATFFDATLSMRRQPITGRTLAAALARYPLMPLRIVVGIYWQAFQLWAKGCPVYGHPAPSERQEAA